MANQITDNRSLIDAAEVATNYDDLTGNSNGTADTEIFYVGSNSIGDFCTTTRTGMLFDAGTTQSAWANSHFYFLVNCGIVGLLATKASGGLTVRFGGNTVTDYIEFEVAGSDDWPTSFSGGWTQFVVDIEATPTNTGGTPPATNAMRYVGISYVTASTMPRMADNIWLDEIRRLGDGNPGIIVEGRNGGSTDWDFDDIIGTAAIVDAATCRNGPGGSVILSAPVQFGINDTTTHGFADTNKAVLWDTNEFVATDLYLFSALGNSGGTTNVTFGVKTGTGDAATGAQGLVMQAAPTAVRWAMVFDDANLDAIGMFGCSFIHGGTFQLDEAAVEIISSQYIDCTSATVSNSLQLRNKIIDASTADGAGFLITDDATDIRFCEFEFSDGHAIETTTPLDATQETRGNLFAGYGANDTNDAAFYNNAGGSITLSVTNSGDSPTVRTAANTDVQNAVTVRVESLSEGAAVSVIADETVGTITAGDVIFDALANSSGVAEITDFNYEGAFDPSGLDVIVRARQQGIPNAAIQDDNGAFADETTAANSNTTNDINLLPATPVVNQDRYLFGHAEQFGGLRVSITTAGTGGFTITPQYWNGAWVNLSGVTDATNNLSLAGDRKITWTIPGDWATSTINSQGPFYYVRLAYTAGTVTITPLARRAQLDVTRYLPFPQIPTTFTV